MTRLQIFLDSNPGSIALLVPSIRDVLSGHTAFPQCELSSEYTDDPVCFHQPGGQVGVEHSHLQRIKFLPNPCHFRLNDVLVAVTSVDVLFHLRKEEVFKTASGVDMEPGPRDSLEGETDSMTRLCGHLLEQRRLVHYHDLGICLTYIILAFILSFLLHLM